jgi:hypothetical protein
MVKVVGGAAAVARDAHGRAPAIQAAPTVLADPRRSERRSISNFIVALLNEHGL